MGEDFIIIRFPDEHSRGDGLFSSMMRFSEVVEDMELTDFLLQ